METLRRDVNSEAKSAKRRSELVYFDAKHRFALLASLYSLIFNQISDRSEAKSAKRSFASKKHFFKILAAFCIQKWVEKQKLALLTISVQCCIHVKKSSFFYSEFLRKVEVS